MNIEVWTLILGASSLAATAWFASRWRYLRRVTAMQRKLLSLDGSHQSTLRSLAQARKQIKELESLMSEYRRRLATAETARRSAVGEKKPPLPVEFDEAAALPRRPPVVWADTQPL